MNLYQTIRANPKDDAQRGGAGNIGSPGLTPTNNTPGDVDVVPEAALRPSSENYHVGVCCVIFFP